jgi:glutamate dehydrogenase
MDTVLESGFELHSVNYPLPPTSGANIIGKAQAAGLDPRVLYEAVIDLSADGLLTANCINLAAGILLKDLGLPRYFFAHIQKPALAQLLQSIASNIRVVDGRVELFGRVAHIDFNLSSGNEAQRVRIATEETRDSMEIVLESLISGHRREYYYSPESGYYTYIIRPETVADFPAEAYNGSRFLFALAGDYDVTPQPTRKRYEKFLQQCEAAVTPPIEVFNLPETGETRLMFKSDFESPQLPALRKILADRGYTLVRAYWEPYLSKTRVPSSICSIYIKEELNRRDEKILVGDLRAFLAFALSPAVKEMYVGGALSLREMLFAGNAIDFTHLFIFKESENATDREIMDNLVNKDHQDAFAKRIQDSNKSTYGATLIAQTVRNHSDLVRLLYRLFERRFDPQSRQKLSLDELEGEWQEFEKKISSRFIDFSLGYDIFRFMFKIVSCTLKTNFFCDEKRSYSFRFDNRILDPLVFSQFVHGIFFVNGHYSCGTHLRAGDIARGGLRLIRVSRANHDAELDNAVLLNYALGPKAQRIKHKDICESGSKGVVVPHPAYAEYGLDALYDYTEGIMDLILMQDEAIVDYYGKPEMVFFGPDEGTAQMMDAVSLRARERGYRFWRTLTTGKSFGIPHDTYGLLESGETFALYSRGEEGVELQIDGSSRLTTTNMAKVHNEIGERIAISGMTTTSVMSAFRTLIGHYGAAEEELNLMITGGPDGDLGANEIQCYKGRICLIIDGGSVLFDPQGLDKKELRMLAMQRHSVPRVNSLGYPREKLGPTGFMVPQRGRNIGLPDGTVVEDGALFHRTFLVDPANRRYIEQAKIRAFIPCGGFKDTVNQGNVRCFLDNFQELQFIVEGANVFFSDGARRHIATATEIKQIKDTTANKGGVFSSSIAEVLTAFLLGDDYEARLLHDQATRWALIKDIMLLVDRYAKEETAMLIRLHEAQPEIPLFDLSQQSSEYIFTLQAVLEKNLDLVLTDESLIGKVLENYIPAVLVDRLGLAAIQATLDAPELQSYRNTIIAKKLASMAFYRFGADWDGFLKRFSGDMAGALRAIVK